MSFASRINPPRGRRAWRIPEQAEACGLHYLAWGRRRYGEDPIPVARQAGYVYLLVLRGRPVLRFEDGEFRCRAGTFFVLHPGRPMGWRDAPDSEHEILCWIWERPPVIEALRPPAKGWRHWELPEEAIPPLRLLHRATRNELARNDAYSPLAIRQKQTELDIELARRVGHDTDQETELPSGDLKLALNWIDQNPASTRPVADLCDRLDLSPARLNRLFKKHLSQTPLDAINARKIKLATQRLQSGEAVKRVALDLGYRHVHDFSRFYKRQTGRTPSRIVANGKDH